MDTQIQHIDGNNLVPFEPYAETQEQPPAPPLPTTSVKRRIRLPRPSRTVVVSAAVLALAAGTALGWKSSVDRGTVIRNERGSAAKTIGELKRDKAGLESQLSSVRGSLASCKQAVDEIGTVAVALAEYPELVGQAAAAVAGYDFVEMGRIAGVMEQLDARVSNGLESFSGAVGSCRSASAI